MLRRTDRVFAAFFLYTSILAVALPVRPEMRARVLIANVVAFAFYCALLAIPFPRTREYLRDWLPMALFVLAYREMGWFAPESHDNHLEQGWIAWDRALLGKWGLREAIESAGILLPGLLEASYLLVYAVPVYGVALLYATNRRRGVDALVSRYAIGLLGAYALLPYFPSEPPRVVFPGELEPTVTTIFRRWNQSIVSGYGIHLSVFPSAHVSGALAAWLGLRRIFGGAHAIGWTALVYAILVSVATVYGRYHYAADALAGAGVAFAAWAVTISKHVRDTTSQLSRSGHGGLHHQPVPRQRSRGE
jgi:membrane-associated phospholipid phosphatase